MAERQQVRDLSGGPRINPAARTVDTYYRPSEAGVAKPGESGLTQLTKSLVTIQPALDRFLDSEYRGAAKEERAQGEQALREGVIQDREYNKKTFKELVSAGTIPAGASPWFQKGWREQKLRLASQDYGQALLTDWSQDGDLRGSNDPQKVASFLAGKRKEFMEQVNADGNGYSPSELTEVLNPEIDRYEKSVYSAQTNHRISEMEKQVEENTGIEISKVLGDTTLDFGSKAGRIQATVDDMVAKGLDGSKANKAIVDAVSAFAKDTKSREALDLLKAINGGSGPVGNTTYAKAKYVETSRYLDQASWEEESREYTREDRAWAKIQRDRTRISWGREDKNWGDSQGTKDLQAQIFVDIVENPYRDITKTETWSKLREINAPAAASIIGFQNAITAYNPGAVDPNSSNNVVAIRAAIMREGATYSPDKITTAFKGREITKEEAMRLFDEYTTARTAEHANHPFLKDDTFKKLASGLAQSIRGSEMNIITDKAQDASSAEVFFYMAARDYLATNPKTTQDAFLERMMKKQTELGNTFGGPNKIGESVTSKLDGAGKKYEPETDQSKAKIMDLMNGAGSFASKINAISIYNRVYGPGMAEKLLGQEPK